MAKRRKTSDTAAEDRINDLQKAFDIAAEDRISNLPDDILSIIVLLLPLEEAASTCLLSKRWQKIWLHTMAFCMNFDIDFNTCHFEPLATPRPYTKSAELLRLEDEGWYNVDYVDKLIENHEGLTIDQFRVFFNLDYSFREQINEWVKFAMRKKAKILQLNFQFGYNGKRRYKFPKTFLHIKRIGFESFRVIEFKYVNVVGEILEHLLSHCPVLERLTVHHSETLKNLRVVGPSPMFKYLDFGSCKLLERVEIRDSNLVSFSFTADFGIVDILVKNVPKLVEVSTPFFYYISKFSDYCSQLQILKMPLFGEKSDGYRYRLLPMVIPYKFTNLKHLELKLASESELCLQQINSLMMVSPYLQIIVLKMPLNEPDYGRRFYSTYECHHECLELVKVLNYSGSATGDAFVDYFIKNAAALKKIVIKTRKNSKTYSSKDNARSHALEQLKPKIPSTITFICL